MTNNPTRITLLTAKPYAACPSLTCLVVPTPAGDELFPEVFADHQVVRCALCLARDEARRDAETDRLAIEAEEQGRALAEWQAEWGTAADHPAF
jgi:hypothetical protein